MMNQHVTCTCGHAQSDHSHRRGTPDYPDVCAGLPKCLCKEFTPLSPAVNETSVPPGKKFDSGKLRFSLLPWEPIRGVIKVLEFGAAKYQIDNWMHVADARRRYFDAAMRHLVAWQEGEKLDSESGLPHLHHAICYLLFLAWHDEQPAKEVPPTV